jgi:parallel beta-helix repeat protein
MKSGLLAGLTILTLLIPVSAACSAEEEMPFHDPIVITEDGDFTAANGVRGGTGTKDDPFTIEDLRIDASGNDYGISISQVKSFFVIRGVSVQSASKVGIELVEVSNSKVESCTIDSNKVGLILESCSLLSIEENQFISCGGIGIVMRECKNSTLTGNEFIGRGSGLCVYEGSTCNTIEENNFKDLALVAFYLGSGGNWIYHNNFFRAIVQDYAYNVWDKEEEGNYWGKSYRGEDKNKDKIGDSPHQVSGPSYNYDRYPLMEPWQP